MRLQYTVNDYLFEIWPLDGWSRKIILREVEKLNIPYSDQFTTMGTSSLQFSQEHYITIKQHLNGADIEL